MKLTKVVPFLVEDELMRLGAIFETVRDWPPRDHLEHGNFCERWLRARKDVL